MFVDSHCHINFPELASKLPDVLASMAKNRVTHALCIGVNLPELPGVLAYGATREDVVQKVEALALRVLADKLENGEAVPQAMTEIFAVAP